MGLKIDTNTRRTDYFNLDMLLLTLPLKLEMLGGSKEAYDEMEQLYYVSFTPKEERQYENGSFAICILKDFCRLETPILERYIKLLVLLDDDDSLFDWDKEILKEELNRIKKVISLEGEYDGMYVTEDGQIYNQMYKALEHAKENPLMYTCYEIHKKKEWSKKDECIFWYNRSCQLVGYELFENEGINEEINEEFWKCKN